ncbi:hypothetical protein A7P98_00460 [Eikenella sp. NML080894]|uniref:phage holin family protein n=1 Tax=Eikenella TaxID=538 RepID=UPI0007DF9952|nr:MULTISPECIES: phage holin family protein [Eikenella]OAM37663.1 hypothetical protein A7P98_00460 [Eikenella sp. NML080894]OAM38439.1 hypothetical protein A7P99_04590 [Eikenella sp. NML120348]OAM44697.1 hypothetical protein A7Q03_07750 [Eikenella sp. NML99-0057]
MSLKHNINHICFLINQGADLLLLRLQILGIDLSGQATGFIKITATLLAGSVLLLAALVSLFFGLDAVLPVHVKIWVFFSLPVLLLLIAWFLLSRTLAGWRQAGVQVASTLADMRRDLDILRGHTAGTNTQPANITPEQPE